MEKIILFLATLLLFTVAGVIFVNPQGMQPVSGGVAPIFEFKDYTFYNIDGNGVDEYLVAAEGFHYPAKEVLTEITYYKKRGDGVDMMESDMATIYQNYSDFNGTVVYSQNGEYKLISKDVRYNKKTNTVVGKQPFVIYSEAGEVKGDSFMIDSEKRILKADAIRAFYTYE